MALRLEQGAVQQRLRLRLIRVSPVGKVTLTVPLVVAVVLVVPDLEQIALTLGALVVLVCHPRLTAPRKVAPVVVAVVVTTDRLVLLLGLVAVALR
jgi:hypothetical protein